MFEKIGIKFKMYDYFVIALQVYCIYHLFKDRNTYYWIFDILFVRLFRSGIYLITQVDPKGDADKIQDNVVYMINHTKRIKDLEKRLQFSETYQNRVNLADAYLENKDYKSAIPHYLDALHDNLQNDLYATKQLIVCYYNVEAYDEVILYAETIKDNSEFLKSKSQFFYGLALEKLGRLDEAEANLRQIDIRYSFYEERFILAKFL